MSVYRTSSSSEPTTVETSSRVLLVAGGLLLAVGACFGFRELELGPEWLPAVLLAATGISTALGFPKRWRWAAPSSLLATTGACFVAWALSPWRPLQVACALATLPWAVVVNVIARRRGLRTGETVWELRLRWQSLAIAAAGASLPLYFHLLRHGIAADASFEGPRRMVLSIGWMALGGAVVLWGRRRGEHVGWAGSTLLGLGYLKVLFYDTVETYGAWRVAILVVGGAIVLGLRTTLALVKRRAS